MKSSAFFTPIAKCIAIILFIFCIDYIIGSLFEKIIYAKNYESNLNGDINYIKKEIPKLKNLVLGSSRAAHQLDPAILFEMDSNYSFNAGKDGIGMSLYCDLFLKLLLANKIKPERLVLQLDASNFEKLDIGVHINQISQFYPYHNQTSILNSYLKDPAFRNENVKLLFKTYRYNGKILSNLIKAIKGGKSKIHNGYIPLLNRLDTLKSPLKALIYNKNKTIDTFALNALKEINRTCNENNIKLTIILPSNFSDILIDTNFNNIVIKELIKIVNKDNILDYSTIASLPILNNQNLWADATHLNNEGAKLFSTTIKENIKNK